MKKFFPYFLILGATFLLYYKLFILGKIPFPGDLLIGSYSPWLDYYKMPVQNPLISDVFSQFFLWKYLAIDSFKNFQIPLWNPYSFTGTPLLATYHSAALYPLNILLLLPKYFGWGLYIFSQTLIAALCFYLFISQISKSILARLFGTIVFSLGGLMTTWLELGTAVHGMAWLPLGLYAIKKYYTEFKLRFLLVLVISLSLTTFAGNAQVTTYSFLLIIFYSLYNQKKSAYKLPNVLMPFIAIALTIMLTAIQLLPSLELLQNSIRQTESYIAEANFGLLSIKDFFKFFIADYFGNPTTGNYWGNLNYSETSGFLGILALPLLIYGLIKLRNRQATFFIATMFVSLLLAFDNPLSFYIYNLKIPLLTSSYASRMLFVTLISVSVICTLALDHLKENKSFRLFLTINIYSWAALVGIVVGTILTYFFVSDIIAWSPSESYTNFYSQNIEYSPKSFIVGIRNTVIPLILISILLTVSIILNIYKRGIFLKHSYLILTSLILFLSFFDLGRYFLKFNPYVSSNLIFPKVPALEFLQKQSGYFRVGREHAEVFPPNTWTAYNLYTYEGYDPIYLNNYGRFMHFLNGGDIRLGNSSRYAEVSSNYNSPYLDAANMKYFIAVLRDDVGRIPGDILHYKIKESGFNLIFKDKSAAILENPKALNRVYLAPNILNNMGTKVEDLMMDKNFDPRKTVALTDDLNITQTTGKGEAKISYYSPNLVKVNTNTQSEEVLVLSDQYEKGWKAKVNGEQTKISQANFIFRAVKVPSGLNEITFYYEPESFKKGALISSLTAFGIVILSFWFLKKKYL